MNSNRWAAVFLLVGGMIGFGLGGGVFQRSAIGQPAEEGAAAPASPRFQVSAWGASGLYGCYIVDSTTGKLWYVSQAGSPKKISGSLVE